jgi:hypothetical protein
VSSSAMARRRMAAQVSRDGGRAPRLALSAKARGVAYD